MITRIGWDSEFFNLNVGELNFDNIKDSSNASDYDLIVVKSAANHNLQISAFVNSFSEQKIVFTKNLFSNSKKNDAVISYKLVRFDIDEVYALALESGKHSRFLLDKKFESGIFEKLYKKWVDNSMYSDFADDVLFFVEKDKILGLVTYKVKDLVGSIGLIAVSPTSQGNGIGSILLQNLEAILYEKGVRTLTIPTQQQNADACAFYQKKGYEISEITYIKHYWKEQ